MAAMMKNLSRVSRILLLLTVAMSTPLMAQLGEDPTSIPFPEFGIYDPDRAVVMTVQFNSNIDVELLDVIVANTRAPSSIGDPPLLLLELLDHNGELIATQNAWHPLWERQWDETGSTESGCGGATVSAAPRAPTGSSWGCRGRSTTARPSCAGASNRTP